MLENTTAKNKHEIDNFRQTRRSHTNYKQNTQLHKYTDKSIENRIGIEIDGSFD